MSSVYANYDRVYAKQLQRNNAVAGNHSWSSATFLQHSVQRSSGIIEWSWAYIMIHDRNIHENIHCSPSSLQQRYSPHCRPITFLSILTRSKVHHPHIRHQPSQALLELPMCRVLFCIILPVLLTCKLQHKSVRIRCLPACQPNSSMPCYKPIYRPEAREKKKKNHYTGRGKKKGNMKEQSIPFCPQRTSAVRRRQW